MILQVNGLVIENENFSVTYAHKVPPKVVISVPHDGLIKEDFSNLFIPRKHGWKGRDKYVWPIVSDLLVRAAELKYSIDAVRFLMSRAYVDANREVKGDSNIDPDTLGQIAFDDPKLARVYGHYHEQIIYLLRRSISTHGAEQVLFIDMHGFGKQPKFAPDGGYDLILGTANRTTVPFGEMDKEFATFMGARGYKVFLPTETPISPNGDPYSAGHITRLYAKKFGINALQIEIDAKFRQLENKDMGQKLAADMAEFFCL